MRSWVPLVIALVLLAMPSVGAADLSGEITSDAPVDLYGDGKASGSDLFLYHHAFRDGSLGGKVYSGFLVEHARVHVPSIAAQTPECYTLDGHEETQTGPSADSHEIFSMIDFGLSKDAFARVKVPGDLQFQIREVGEPQDLTKPFLHLGPNPYVAGDIPDTQDVPDAFAPAFSADAFSAVPAQSFSTTGTFGLELEWGEMHTVQRERDRVHKAGVFDEQRPVASPNPLSPTTMCDVRVTRWVEFEQTVAAISVDQSGVERIQSYWHDGQTGKATESGAPAGHWDRSRGSEFAAELERLHLPSTLVAGSQIHLSVAGEARFNHALGSVRNGADIQEAKDSPLTIAGHPDLEPLASEEGRRMTTRVGGDAGSVAVLAPREGWQWTLDAPLTIGVIGGVAALAVAAWTWPALKFKGTQWLLFPLYARLKKEDLLENPLRDDILGVVQQSPGISASELGRRLECGWGTLVYHLTVLERMQLISSAREGRHKRFFVQGRINYSDKGAVGLLANASARTILDAIKDRPGLIQRDLGRLLGLSPGTVAWHVDRLEGAGLILKEEEGRVVRYYPSAKLLELTRQLAA